MPPNLSYCSLTFLSLFRNPNYSSLNRWRCLNLCQGNWSPKMVIFNIFIKILYKRYTKFPYVGNSKWVWIFKLWKGRRKAHTCVHVCTCDFEFDVYKTKSATTFLKFFFDISFLFEWPANEKFKIKRNSMNIFVSDTNFNIN